jgi:hypothetical protein
MMLQFLSFLGYIYKQRQNLEEPHLTLMLSTDGKPIIKSKQTQSSVWPVSVLNRIDWYRLFYSLDYVVSRRNSPSNS